MTERRSNPIFRCPEHARRRIAWACMTKLIERIVKTKEWEEQDGKDSK